ncbi:MAG: hypothetical protein ACXAB7_18135 [Candidatus Kariarchaeaceae archaeon]|jgi:hypothetical protein
MGQPPDVSNIPISRITQKEEIMQIAEHVAPFFRSHIRERTGKSPRFITVKDIQYSQHMKDHAVDFEVNINYISDQGSWNELIVIRDFKNITPFEDEISRYSRLEKRCTQFANVKILPMISVDRENYRIVYEKQKGYSIYQLGLSQKLVDYTLGRISAIFHGKELINLKQSSSKELLNFLVEHLPFTDEEKGSILTLGSSHLDVFESSQGGYQPCSVLDPNNLFFTPTQEMDAISMDALANKGAIIAVIPIEAPEDIVMDRMTDVATIYSNRAYGEFLSTGSLEETIQSMRNYFQGYDESAKILGIPTFRELYPNGFTLDIHMLISHFLVEIHKLHGAPGGKTGFEDKDPIRYAYYLLVKKPLHSLDLLL